MLLSNRGFINVNVTGRNNETSPGAGANIKLSGELKLVGTSDIQSKTFHSGQTAPIMIEVDKLELREGSQITSNIWRSGQGNQITIKANEIVLSGLSDMMLGNTAGAAAARNASGIVSASYTSKPDAVESTVNIEAKQLVIEDLAQINVASLGAGNAGSVNLNVERLEMRTGMIISTAMSSGDGGAINIKADEIVLSDLGSINSSGFGFGGGKAGNITIETNKLALIDGGNINVSTMGFGESGAINIKVLDTFRLLGQADDNMFLVYDFVVKEQSSGLLTLVGLKPEDLVGPSRISAAVINLGTKSAGRIDIEAGRLLLHDGARITGEHRGMGDAGDIAIRASDIRLEKGGTITTETKGGGGGGNITLHTPNLVYLREGEITTSVGTGKGQGGDISIENPLFVVLDNGLIKAQADEGRGGDISIHSDRFMASRDSLVSASSRLGIDGDVKIESPDVDLSGLMVVLPGGYVEAELPKGCQSITDLAQLSTFRATTAREGMMMTPEGFPE